MAYMKIYTENGTWVCPETGDYKIICVGRGGDGDDGTIVGQCGKLAMTVMSMTEGASVSCSFSDGSLGATTFGLYLSAANGGAYSAADEHCTYSEVGGEGGYTLDGVYGGHGAMYYAVQNESVTSVVAAAPATKNGGAAGESGFGYGAGGGSESSYGTNGIGGAVIIQRM